MDDERILDLFFSRDEQALSELETKYGRQLQCLAERILPAEDAKECLNDTYLALWKNIPPNRPTHLFAYAAKICRNLTLNKFEWNEASKRSSVMVDLADELETCIPNKFDLTDQVIWGEVISRFLKGLSAEQRRMFVRRYWYGESMKELAATFGCRQSKVKSVLFRVRNRLREYLEKEDIFL